MIAKPYDRLSSLSRVCGLEMNGVPGRFELDKLESLSYNARPIQPMNMAVLFQLHVPFA